MTLSEAGKQDNQDYKEKLNHEGTRTCLRQAGIRINAFYNFFVFFVSFVVKKNKKAGTLIFCMHFVSDEGNLWCQEKTEVRSQAR